MTEDIASGFMAFMLESKILCFVSISRASSMKILKKRKISQIRIIYLMPGDFFLPDLLICQNPVFREFIPQTAYGDNVPGMSVVIFYFASQI